MIRFSIVTITYQAAKVLPHTLESVWRQTYPQVEHIIVDGASTDGTVALAQAYEARHRETDTRHEVVVRSEPDRGLYDAMNKGLRLAGGDYILFLNAGDAFPTGQTLEQVAGSVGEGEELPAVLYGDTDIVDGEYRFLRHRHFSAPEQLTWRSFRKGMLVCHQAFYARADIARALPYNLDYRFSADVDWCIRVMKEAEKHHLPLRNVHAVVAEYLEEGQTTQNHWASLKERYRVMCGHYGSVRTFWMHLWLVLRMLKRRCLTFLKRCF